MLFVREPIVFPDKDSVHEVLKNKLRCIEEDGKFKLCNFSGPGWTHAEGCREASKMFQEQHPEFIKPKVLNAWLSKFRCGAIFSCRTRRSVVVFVSTTSTEEIGRLWKPMADKVNLE